MDVKLYVRNLIPYVGRPLPSNSPQSSGSQGFHLSFHLPFLAWRQHSTPSVDARRTAGNQPLRATRDVSFLGRVNGQSPTYMHEAQLSCMIVGLDNRQWTAYSFFDTYHDGGESKHDVLSYQSTQGGLMMDPLTCGRFVSENPVTDAREYFLRVMESCIAEIKEEWQNAGRQVLKSLKPSVSTPSPDHRSGLITHGVNRSRAASRAEPNAWRTEQSNSWSS